MQEIKNSATEMNNNFDGLITVLNTAKEKISEIKDKSIETFQSEKSKRNKKKKKKKNRLSKIWGQL